MLAAGVLPLPANMTNEPGTKSHGLKKNSPRCGFDFLGQALTGYKYARFGVCYKIQKGSVSFQVLKIDFAFIGCLFC